MDSSSSFLPRFDILVDGYNSLDRNSVPPLATTGQSMASSPQSLSEENPITAQNPTQHQREKRHHCTMPVDQETRSQCMRLHPGLLRLAGLLSLPLRVLPVTLC
ncbi:uncharacterized protein ASPGLDRAFT_1054438 [Aspergillus glaucus CBS 516.65]|uniref:Uncharacterized protein n=1 Tax=Aspergillus glaucus CBS 516.65 TaxID=1160497 RepID=A0A1L9V5X0_ASPGL|nr:hypothetical protein ASPGLDRAFT_1054438 [Aspergillus glaucus CBS 516.65]OJJ79281.1 hypothetical protein ASPGLDRAFT_1054438 [Aspergillus glaucus CBS 516.65]